MGIKDLRAMGNVPRIGLASVWPSSTSALELAAPATRAVELELDTSTDSVFRTSLSLSRARLHLVPSNRPATVLNRRGYGRAATSPTSPAHSHPHHQRQPAGLHQHTVCRTSSPLTLAAVVIAYDHMHISICLHK